MVVHDYIPRIWEVDAARPEVPGHPQLHSDFELGLHETLFFFKKELSETRLTKGIDPGSMLAQ